MFGPLGARQISRILPRHPRKRAAICSTSSTTFSTCPRSRPAASRSTSNSVDNRRHRRRQHEAGRARVGESDSSVNAATALEPRCRSRPARDEADHHQSAVERGEIHAATAAASRCAVADRRRSCTSRSKIPASASRRKHSENLGKPFEQVESQLTKNHRGSGWGSRSRSRWRNYTAARCASAHRWASARSCWCALPVDAAPRRSRRSR